MQAEERAAETEAPREAATPRGATSEPTREIVEQAAETVKPDDLALLFEPGDVVELRAPNVPGQGVISGYFDDFARLAEACRTLSGRAPGVYVTINPVDPAAVGAARVTNVAGRAGESTKDPHIRCRRWLPFDFDPARPGKVSSTAAEHEAALARARDCRSWLLGLGVPADATVLADSGNGAHLLVRVDLPNDDASKRLVERCLRAAAARLDDQAVRVDTTVGNASRIWKAYGTLAAKGEATAERPHRLARLLDAPETIAVTPRAVLDVVAAAWGGAGMQGGAGIEEPKNAPGWAEAELEAAATPIGEQDAMATKLAGFLAQQGRSEYEATTLLYDWAQRLNQDRRDPWTRDAIASKVRRMIEKEAAKPPTIAVVGDSSGGEGSGAGDEHLTDVGNARRLAQRHGKDLQYVKARSAWLVWDGTRWACDETGEVMRRAKETVRSLYAQAATVSDSMARKQLAGWARASESDKNLRAMVSQAQSEAGIATTPRTFDADPFALNCLNGTLDLRTGVLRERRREDRITRLAPVVYDPDATHPVWERLLADATGGDEEMQGFLQRAVGYSLTGDTGEEVLFFVYGPAATGKSTFIEAVKAALGDYADTANFETFLKQSHVGGAREDLARLDGVRLVTSIEVEEGKQLAEGIVKAFTGGDTVAARRLYQATFQFRPQFKLWLVANHRPSLSPEDEAMWRRILVVPFDRVVPQAQRDPSIKAVLRDPTIAGPAVLAWAVKGALTWQKERLGAPASVKSATAAYREEMDTFGAFVRECCVLDRAQEVAAAALHRAAAAFFRGVGDRPLGQRALAKVLEARGLKRRVLAGRVIWQGICLTPEAEALGSEFTVATA
jgi:putative DNA primase/helicase